MSTQVSKKDYCWYWITIKSEKPNYHDIFLNFADSLDWISFQPLDQEMTKDICAPGCAVYLLHYNRHKLDELYKCDLVLNVKLAKIND